MDYNAEVASDWFNPYGNENPASLSSTQPRTGANGNLRLPESFAATLEDDAS